MPKGGGKVRKRQDSASSGAGDGGESAANQSAGNSTSANGGVRAGSLERGCCHPVQCSCDDPLDLARNAVKVICSNEGCPESSFMHDRCFDKWEDSVLDHLSCAPRIVTGRFLRWPKEKRRESLWTIRGYDLVKKAHVEVCKCKCGKGYLRKDTEWRPEEDPSAKKKKQKKGGSSQQQQEQQQKQQHKQQQQQKEQQQQQKEHQQPAQQQQQQAKQAKPTLNHPVVKWPASYMLPISERSTPPIPEHYIPGLNLEDQNGQKKKKKKKRSKSGKSETSSLASTESKPPSPDEELNFEPADAEEAVKTVDKEGGAVEQLVELGFSRQASEEAVQIHGSMEEALDFLLKSSSPKTNGDKIADKELSSAVAPPRKVDSNGNLTVPYPVQQLMSLGFSREDSEAALRIHDNLDCAVEYLMAQRQFARYRNNPPGNGFVVGQPLAPTPFTSQPLGQFLPQNGPVFSQPQLFLQQNVEVPTPQIPTPYSNPTSQLFPSLPPGFLQHQVPTPPQPPPSVPSIDDHVPREAPAVKTHDKTDMSYAMQRLMDMGFSYRQSEAAFKQHGHLDSALDALISGEFDDMPWETQPKRNANKTDPFTNKPLIENSNSDANTNQGGTFPSWHPMQSQNFISSLDTFSLPSKVPVETPVPVPNKQPIAEDPITAISVKVLTDMGFTPEQSYKAIKQHGTVEAALNSLITSAFNQSGSLDTEVYMSDEEDFPEHLSPPKQNHSKSAFHPVVPRATQVAPRFAATVAQAPVSQKPTFSTRLSAPTARPAGPKVVTVNGNHGKAPGSTPTPCAALWVGNVSSKVSQADLQSLFGKYGRILSIKIIHNKTCAFVNFTNMADATRARDGLQGTEVGGMELVIRFPDNPIINADGNFLMMKSKLKTGNQNGGGQSAGKASQAQSTSQQGKVKGPVETEFGEECFFYRTTGCHFGKNCSYLHIPHHKGVDL
ncbi:PREDICTED: uncharacterized protein LOC109479920 [Branchiostoma belcheri]|uniref:Uncharacterized protein LOC109479920 n=1 Tax=Branchiostoma belcheri TaxID=7741 RepID=A0A6P5A2V7_BRABE|nr:PREDICTED: uncharacterized protein LOC109479920 [Branchiostoma belcheri]XP_019637542.1 PREDICTED: uncharacterized protein LOC109479920 [Branchiostoma belcheri]